MKRFYYTYSYDADRQVCKKWRCTAHDWDGAKEYADTYRAIDAHEAAKLHENALLRLFPNAKRWQIEIEDLEVN